MSEENKYISISARVTPEVHNQLQELLQRYSVSRKRKVSLADLVSASLHISNKEMNQAINKVLRTKVQIRKKKSEIGRKVTSLSPEALAKVQAIIDAEEGKSNEPCK